MAKKKQLRTGSMVAGPAGSKTKKSNKKPGKPTASEAQKAAMTAATISFATEVVQNSGCTLLEIEQALGIAPSDRSSGEGSSGLFSKYCNGGERLSARRLVQLAHRAHEIRGEGGVRWLSKSSYLWILQTYVWSSEARYGAAELEMKNAKAQYRVLLPAYESLRSALSAMTRYATDQKIPLQKNLYHPEFDDEHPTPSTNIARIRREITSAIEDLVGLSFASRLITDLEGLRKAAAAFAPEEYELHERVARSVRRKPRS